MFHCRATSRFAAAALLISLLAACAAPEPAALPSRTLPVSVLVRQAATASRESEEPPINAVFLVEEVARTLREAAVFSEVSAAGAPGDASLQAKADYVCEVEVRGTSFAVERSVATSGAVLSTVVWACLFPPWWVDDRGYPESDIDVRVRFLPAASGAAARPFLSAAFPTSDIELDLWRRGRWWHLLFGLFVPSFWMEDAPTAEAALEREAIGRVRRDLVATVRSRWPAAALRGEPGCLLVLDPGREGSASAKQTADLRGWLVSRAPLFEVRVLDENGRVLGRVDQKTLPGLLIPLNAASDEGRRAWGIVRSRLGAETPAPKTLYRIDLGGLAGGGASKLRIEARASAGGVPARFTAPLGPEAAGE